MALAKKCDICGKFYEPYSVKEDKEPNGVAFIHVNDRNGDWWAAGRGKLDCCPECMESILIHIMRLKDKKHIDPVDLMNGGMNNPYTHDDDLK